MQSITESRARHAISDVVEDFEWTRDYHRGDISLAALRLGMSEDALEQSLYRARRKGYAVGQFHRASA